MVKKNVDGWRERAKYGSDASAGISGSLPLPFPREMGHNTMNYLKEVVDSGLTSDMISRFEERFAREMGVEHCVATVSYTHLTLPTNREV